MKKKIFIVLGILFGTVLLCFMGITGTVAMKYYKEWQSNQIRDDYRLIAESEQGYQVYECEEEGKPAWKGFKGGELQYTKIYVKDSIRVCYGFLDEYLVYMIGSDDSKEITIVWENLDEIRDDDEQHHEGYVPADDFTVFPVIENVEMDEGNIWIELRYHCSEDDLSEETVMYHATFIPEKIYCPFVQMEK